MIMNSLGQKVNEHLQYFDLLFFGRGVEAILDSYINNEKLIGLGYAYIPQHGGYFKEEMIYDGPDAQFHMECISLDDFFTSELKELQETLFRNLEKEKVNMPDDSFKNFLSQVYDKLLIYSKRAKENKSKERYKEYWQIIYMTCKTMSEDFKLIYSVLIPEHPFYNLFFKRQKTIYAFFSPDDRLKSSFFKDLYELSYELNLIDDGEISEVDFIEVFTSPKPQKKIYFIQNNYVVAYFLKQIEIFFISMNPTSIEKSQSFFNKQDKPITKQDLYSAIKRGEGKIGQWKKHIDEEIEELKYKHLE